MREALNAKFRLPGFREALLDTADIIGEGTYDRTWGVGIGMADKRAFAEPFRGENNLGVLLMEIKRGLK